MYRQCPPAAATAPRAAEAATPVHNMCMYIYIYIYIHTYIHTHIHINKIAAGPDRTWLRFWVLW